MSDNEEPAAKLLKLQSQNPANEEEMDEGQEEWLSEGVLTDDDYNPATEQERSDYANMSQDDTMHSANDSLDHPSAYHDTGDSNAQDGHENDPEENIEQALNNLENSQGKEFPGELGAFLIRKTDGRPPPKETQENRESEVDESTKQSDDDGHDTDELLRMLGEDGVKIKKKQVMKNLHEKQKEETTDDEDDDEYIFEGAKVTRLKMAKNAFVKQYPSKAVPEELSDKEEDSEMVYVHQSDEVATIKNMFGVTRRPNNVASKSTTIGGINALQTVTKKVISLDGKSEKLLQPTPQRRVILKRVRKSKEATMESLEPEPDEIINEEEFLDEEEFDLDEEIETEEEGEERHRQRIMRPERMDEEVPTDAESLSDEDSLYDEMPSSESEDLDEWFTLDIRAERAGDYLPILGGKAKQLLLKEKHRVGARLATLRQSLSALTESGRQQSEQLRKATATLAEMDAALKAT